MAGRYFDEWKVGDVIAHSVTRTVTETDNVLVSALTHNPQPMHLDHEVASASEFGKPLVNSCFTFSLVVGVSVADTTLGTLIANLGFDEVKFPKPVFYGDTLRFESECVAVRESNSRASALCDGATLSSRSKITASASLASAFIIFLLLSAGTNSQLRGGAAPIIGASSTAMRSGCTCTPARRAD